MASHRKPYTHTLDSLIAQYLRDCTMSFVPRLSCTSTSYTQCVHCSCMMYVTIRKCSPSCDHTCVWVRHIRRHVECAVRIWKIIKSAAMLFSSHVNTKHSVSARDNSMRWHHIGNAMLPNLCSRVAHTQDDGTTASIALAATTYMCAGRKVLDVRQTIKSIILI